MIIEQGIEEVKVEKGMGIWGNMECAQCGACCYEYNKYLHEIEARNGEQCKNFIIEDGKAYCLAHDKEREPLCEKYFCGNTDFIFRFMYEVDERLRNIAESLGTAPSSYSIPKLLPKSLNKF